MKKISSIVFISLFISLLLLPSLFMERRQEAISYLDNRNLYTIPSIGEDDFFANFEKALSDRIFGRNSAIKLYTILNDKLFNIMIHPSYSYGKDGYVFGKMHENVIFGDYHKKFANFIVLLDRYCKDRNIKFYFMFDPEKNSVYREYLPEGINYDDTWVELFLNELKDNDVNCIDNKELLREKAKTEAVFNKKYDAGHWNDIGMFYGMNNLFSVMHNDFPSVKELELTDFQISTKTVDSLLVSNFPINETVPEFITKNTFLDFSDKYEVSLDNNFRHFHYYVNENSNEKPKILVFQGSYLIRSNNFMINNSSVEIEIHNYQNIFDIDSYVNFFRPDCIVFEVAEYVFFDKYFDSNRMNAIQVLNQNEIAFEVDRSKGVKKTGLRDYYFNSLVEDNPISDLRLQIYNPKTATYQIIFSEKEENNVSNIYTHEMDTGLYYCVLNINTPKRDEYVKFQINLTNNEQYYYKFVISLFDENMVFVRNFSFEKYE